MPAARPEPRVYVGYGLLHLHLPHARDLKAKRRVVRGLVDRIHARLRISVAETGANDLHQRAEIGVAVVAKDAGEVESLLEQVRNLAENEVEAMVLSWDPIVVEESRP